MTGVVFVHGIGTQPARETLEEWAAPIIELLTEWRRGWDATCPGQPIGRDPLVGASAGERPWVDLRIPGVDDRPEARWLLTEAYWAGDVRAPSFGDAFGYLRSRIRRVIDGIATGYGLREPARRRRLRELLDTTPPVDEDTRRMLSDLARSLDWRWRIVDVLDGIWQLRPVRWTLAVIATIASIAAMTVYAPLRAIPIEGVRKRVEQAAFDTWLVDWFGDLPTLLDSPIAGGIARRHLVDAICWLREMGAEQVVVVAHSGGAIVSFSTLLEHSPKKLPVDKLITLGQGLALGWRLEMAGRTFDSGNPIRGDLGRRRPNLRWVDFWASYDPGPAGELKPVPGGPLLVRPASAPAPAGTPIIVESRPVTNFMHLGMDHGGYWQNDEGFLVPLVRHIDDPTGDGTGSRFYASPLARSVRIERRRRRVGILLGWRWASFAAGVAALVVAAREPIGLEETGNAIAGLWSKVPLNEIVSIPIDAIGGIVALLLAALGRSDLAAFLAPWGPRLLGAVLVILLVFVIYRRGVGSWQAADAEERLNIRREIPGPSGLAWARSEGALLVGGLTAVILAATSPPAIALVWFLIGVAGIAAVVRLAR